MILPRTADAPHKYQMYRLLAAILGDSELARGLVFKGGTCAALRSWLDRFSIDLDFDLSDKADISRFRPRLQTLFKTLGFSIKDQSREHLQFFLKYPSRPGLRNTLKLEINDDVSPQNEQEIANLAELNLTALTQTQATMVASKLVAAKGRFQNHGTIAGRDFYDLHHFLTNGYEIKKAIVEERTGKRFDEYLDDLIKFIETRVTDKLIFEDLNPLLPATQLKSAVGKLREELLWMLRSLKR